MRNSAAILGVLLFVSAASFAGTPQAKIEGNYMESRSCDVYTAPCNANSEIGLVGKQATMAWQVTRGTQDGVDLSGLSVVAVISTDSTLTDTSQHEFKGQGIVIVDEKANAAQRDALVQLAKTQSGSLLSDVVKVETAPIEMKAGGDQPEGSATLTAGDLVNIQTRCLHETDKHCGNDHVYYPPLTRVDAPMAVYTQHDKFTGEGLGVTWDEADRRSAFVARFEK